MARTRSIMKDNPDVGRTERLVVVAKTLKEVAEEEGINIETARKRKDLFAEVHIQYGEKDENGNRKNPKTRIRFLGTAHTNALKALELTSPEDATTAKNRSTR